MPNEKIPIRQLIQAYINCKKELTKRIQENYLGGIISQKEFKILEQRFLHSLTLVEVKKSFGVTAERIKQLEVKAIANIEEKDLLDNKNQ